MDYTQPESHYEQVIQLEDSLEVQSLKNRAYKAMGQLEGWCSQEKASILIDLILAFKPQTVVEIGVYGGKSLIPMAFAMKELGRGSVIGIDPWNKTESTLGMDLPNFNFWVKIDYEQIYRGLIKNIMQLGLRSQIQILRKSSKDAAPIRDIDMLHIDGNHSEESSFFDVTKWVPLVKKGGFIIFSDMTWVINGKVSTKKAMDWLDANCVRVGEFGRDSIWGIWIKS